MDTIRLKDKEFKIFIPEAEIKAAIADVAIRIKHDMEGKDPLFVGVLTGAFVFVAELMLEMNGNYEVTFTRYQSYDGTGSTGQVREVMPLTADIKGRTVILLEDIVDSGLTMDFLKKKMLEDGAAEVKVATMLFKPDALKCELTVDYVGKEIPNDFIVGFGLDYDELGRSYRDIYKIV